MSSLFVRISLVFFITLFSMGLVILWVANKNSQDYFLESTQRLNAPIAMYMAENTEFVKGNQLNRHALPDLTTQLGVVNPNLEVYLLDDQGYVISTHLVGDELAAETTQEKIQVDLNKIHEFLEGNSVLPILGSNPKKPSQKNIFSAFPLYSEPVSGKQDPQKLGYVYAVLAGNSHYSLFSSISANYSLKSLAILIVGTLLITLIVGLALFFLITHRLRLLIQRVSVWRYASSDQVTPFEKLRGKSFLGGNLIAIDENNDGMFGGWGERLNKLLPLKLFAKDEIDVLAGTYQLMASELTKRNEKLINQDEVRRMFYAAMSHDLRTPLTTMENYLETLLLKDSTLNAEDRRRFIGVAYKQCVKLGKLLIALFDYSKLSSGGVSLQPEYFSLLELSYDCLQQYSLEASHSQLHLSIRTDHDQSDGLRVLADIALIQRVLENLLSNAISNTPSGGDIVINLSRTVSHAVQLEVLNSGPGLSQAVVDNLYSGRGPIVNVSKDQNAGSGLGLFIVKSIVEMHGSEFRITSVPGIGVKCSFCLPT